MTGVKDNFIIKIDKKLCIGCNLCCEIAPEVFYMKGDKSDIRKGVNFNDVSIREKVILASQACAVGAIKVG